MASFAKQVKKMPGFSVTALSSKCRASNAWKRVPYELTQKTKVEVGGAIMTLKEAMGENIFQVWGYEEPDCKQRRSSGENEEVTSLLVGPRVWWI